MKSTFELREVRPKRRRPISKTGMKALWQKQLSTSGQVEYVPAIIRELKVHGLKSERVWLCDVHLAEVDVNHVARHWIALHILDQHFNGFLLPFNREVDNG